jgi:hypothetical protein
MRIVPWLLMFTPLAVLLVAWVIVYRRRQVKTLRLVGVVALGLATANALFGASTFAYYAIRARPEASALGLLFLSTPFPMVLGVVAAVRGTPKWLMGLVELASVPLLVVGLLVAASD